jgi:dynein heavy chain
MRDDDDYLDMIPCGIGSNDEIPLFDKLLILKIFKPEKLLFAFQRYVHKEIGAFYAESPVANMDSLFGNSDNKTPIIFVLSQGADPTQ